MKQCYMMDASKPSLHFLHSYNDDNVWEKEVNVMIILC